MLLTGMDIQTVGTLAALVAVAITVLYILKLRKRRIEVPFSPLWQQVLQEQRSANDLFKRLRRFLSWLLYMVIAAALLVALLDPHPETASVEGRSLVLLVDSSASMGATDVSGAVDRLDLAKRKVREILETVGPDDQVMLVTFNEQIRPVSPFVKEVQLLDPMLAKVEVAATGTSYREAVEFAANALRDVKNGEVIVFSDGAGQQMADGVSELSGDWLPKDLQIRHVKVGEAAGNLAVTSFNVRRYVSNKLDYELFVSLRSYFDRPVEAEIEIWADGQLVDTKPVSLEANGVHQGYYPSQAVSGERLEARVRLTTRDARDVLPVDDRAYALLPPVRKVRVQLVTEGNLYLEGPLLLNPNLDVTRVAPATYDASKVFDVTVFDRVALDPGSTPNLLYLAPSGEYSPWTTQRTAADPIIERIQRGHPLLRWISLKDINIGVADVWALGSTDSVVAASESGVPILVTRRDDARSIVGISFDIRNSDLPLRVAFPVLLINAIDWFMRDDGTLVESYKTGETWAVPFSGEEMAAVTSPSGESMEVPIFERRAVFFGEVPGFYTLKGSDRTQVIAGNMADMAESSILPADLVFGERPASEVAPLIKFSRREPWIWLVLLALALLLVEWWTYNRRITV
jgi:hypothetical protein